MTLPFEQWAWTNRCRGVSAVEKTVLALGSLVLTLAFPLPLACALVLVGMLIALVHGAGVPVRVVFLALLIPGTFALLSLPAIGLAALLTILPRNLAATSCLLFLALTTPLPDLLSVLHRLRVPTIALELLLLVYSSIGALGAALARLNTAQESRLGSWRGRRGREVAALLGTALLVQVIERTHRQHQGLQARGWSGGTLLSLPPLRPARPLVIGVMCLLWLEVIALSVFFGRLLPHV